MILFDADSAAYQGAARVEERQWTVVGVDEVFQYKKHAKEKYPDGEYKLEIIVGDQDDAIQEVDRIVRNVKDEFCNTRELQLYITGEGNYREIISDTYKANRVGKRKPEYVDAMKDYLEWQWGALRVNGYEADDAVSMEAYKQGDHAIISSIDKDLWTVPGYHFNWSTSDFEYVKPGQAEYNFWFQALVGDTTDNIKGCPGVGKVGAVKLLDAADRSEWPEVVANAYLEHGADLDDLEITCRLLWMSKEFPDDWATNGYGK